MWARAGASVQVTSAWMACRRVQRFSTSCGSCYSQPASTTTILIVCKLVTSQDCSLQALQPAHLHHGPHRQLRAEGGPEVSAQLCQDLGRAAALQGSHVAKVACSHRARTQCSDISGQQLCTSVQTQGLSALAQSSTLALPAPCANRMLSPSRTCDMDRPKDGRVCHHLQQDQTDRA